MKRSDEQEVKEEEDEEGGEEESRGEAGREKSRVEGGRLEVLQRPSGSRLRPFPSPPTASTQFLAPVPEVPDSSHLITS